MKKATILSSAIALTAVAALTLNTLAQQDRFSNTDLVGSWQSQGCESFVYDKQPAFMRRSFDFTPSTWQLQYTLFADPACSVALITTRIAGPYALGQAAALPATRQVTWGQTAKFVTPHVPDILGAMNGSGCGDSGLPLGQERDVSSGGCAAFGVASVKDYPQEFDLLKLENGQLFVGQRGEKMNLEANRPTQLFGFAVVRK